MSCMNIRVALDMEGFKLRRYGIGKADRNHPYKRASRTALMIQDDLNHTIHLFSYWSIALIYIPTAQRYPSRHFYMYHRPTWPLQPFT